MVVRVHECRSPLSECPHESWKGLFDRARSCWHWGRQAEGQQFLFFPSISLWMQWQLLCGCKPGDLTSKTASDRPNFIPTHWRRLPLGGYRALLSPFSRLASCRRVAGLTYPSPCAVNRLLIRKVLWLDNNHEVWFVRLA